MRETIFGKTSGLSRFFVSRMPSVKVLLDRIELHYVRAAPIPELVIRRVQIGNITVFPQERHVREVNEPWSLQFVFEVGKPRVCLQGQMLTVELDPVIIAAGQYLDYRLDVSFTTTEELDPNDNVWGDNQNSSGAVGLLRRDAREAAELRRARDKLFDIAHPRELPSIGNLEPRRRSGAIPIDECGIPLATASAIHNPFMGSKRPRDFAKPIRFTPNDFLKEDLGDGLIPYNPGGEDIVGLDSGQLYQPERLVVGGDYDQPQHAIRKQPSRSMVLDDQYRKRLVALAGRKKDEHASTQRARELARPLDEAEDAAWESPSWEEP